MSEAGATTETGLYPRARNAYYLASPPYTRTSAGIKALHLLCHALNRAGERAYMVIHPFLPRVTVTHPDLLTPLLTEDVVQADAQRGLTPIFVYPETIDGNPYRAPFVVRYVMNFPGLLGGERQFRQGELCFGYSAALAQAASAPDNVLFVPVSDPAIFKPEPRVPRTGSCFFAGKYRDFHGGQLLSVTTGSVEITRDRPDSLTPAQMAELFRRSELFYCYENTAVAIEALLCECPVVFLPNEHLTSVIAVKELGMDGCAWGTEPSEIARAKATVTQGRLNYLATYEIFRRQLRRFIEATQAAVREVPYPAPVETKHLNRATRLDELRRLLRSAATIHRRHGWAGVLQKVSGRLKRLARGARRQTTHRW